MRKDGHGGGERRSGRDIVEGVRQETRAGGYNTDGLMSQSGSGVRRVKTNKKKRKIHDVFS